MRPIYAYTVFCFVQCACKRNKVLMGLWHAALVALYAIRGLSESMISQCYISHDSKHLYAHYAAHSRKSLFDHRFSFLFLWYSGRCDGQWLRSRWSIVARTRYKAKSVIRSLPLLNSLYGPLGDDPADNDKSSPLLDLLHSQSIVISFVLYITFLAVAIRSC